MPIRNANLGRIGKCLLALALAGLAGCGLADTIRARQLAREGNALYHDSDYRGAIKKYLEAIELDPDTPNIYLNLGYAYFSIFNPSGDSEQERQAAALAVDAFDRHLNQVPEDETARVFEIKALLAAAPYDPQLAQRARKTFLQLLEKNPNDQEARQYLITLFIDCKLYREAVEFFAGQLQKKPDDIQTMKILAIIADKSNQIQDAVDWYWKRAEVTPEDEKKAVLFYEIGTYAWNLLHFQPDRLHGAEAMKLADQGIAAANRAMKLKNEYAEAMVYGNLLYLKRALYESEEVGRAWDGELAYGMRLEAGRILQARKTAEESKKPETTPEAPPPPAEGAK
jgi:tetratricopeptide (TPR) repeat protein